MTADTLTQDDLLRLGPATYLARGYRDANGEPRHELKGLWALAAANQLIAFQVPPQELAALFEAIRQGIGLHEGPYPDRLYAAMKEASQIVSNMYRKDINFGLMHWATECAHRVKSEADFKAFMDHGKAVIRNHATIVAFRRM